jgi:alpha-1,2-mannosyltransferase
MTDITLPSRWRLPLDRLRVGPLADDLRWLLPIGLGTYVLGTTWTWEFPDWHGIPFPPVWLGLFVTVLLAWRRRVGLVGPIAAAAIVALTAMAMTDVTSFFTQGLRDLGIYVKAGDRWLHGLQVYDQVPISQAPADLTNYPFLYPPLTLPLFGALSLLPFPVAATAWVAASAAALVAGLRRVGLDWRWCLVMFVWPPVLQGLWVGNVAVWLFLFFAIAPWRPWALGVGPIFKVYSGIAGLWLLRREHWRSLAIAILGVVAAVLVTLPLVGLASWSDWLVGLQAYQVSQALVPNLYGFGLARYVPWVVFVVVAAVVLLLALRVRDRRDQLARLGVATVTGSPSLFSHGFLVTLPAMFRLDTPWFWLAFGITSSAPGLAWFAVIGLVVVSWFVPAMRKRAVDDPWHPLGAAAEPWPSAPEPPGLPVSQSPLENLTKSSDEIVRPRAGRPDPAS